MEKTERTANFSILVGAGGKDIQWDRLLMFFVVLLLSGLIGTIMTPSVFTTMPVSYWLFTALRDLFLVGAFVLACRINQNDWIRAVLTALIWVVLSGAATYLFMRSSPMGLTSFYRFAWSFLFIGGLSLSVRRFRPLWLALAAGDFGAGIISHLLFTLSDRIFRAEEIVITVSGEMNSLLYQIVGTAAFTGLFYFGLLILRTPMEESAEAAVQPSGPDDEEGSRLVRTADHLTVKNILRPAAIGSLIFGVVAIGLGLGSAEQNSVNMILAVIGFFMFIEGIWVLTSPHPSGLIVDGILLMVLGTWNIIITINNQAYGSGPVGFLALGAWQIMWGMQSIIRYTRLHHPLGPSPSNEAQARFKSMVEQIRVSSIETQENIVELQAKQGLRSVAVRGLLLTQSALFVVGKKEYLVGSRGEIDVQSKESAKPSGGLSATLHVGKMKYTGRMSRTSLSRLLQWKSRT